MRVTPRRVSRFYSSSNNMEAGRELDKLIAEKVMGNHIEIVHGTIMERNPQLAAELAYYSTNIADAWQVVEKLAVGCIDFNIRRGAFLVYHATFIDSVNLSDIKEYIGKSTTASEAICLAALEFVRINP